MPDRRSRRDGRERRGGLISLGVRGIASGVGLVSESIKAHKEGKEEKKREEESSRNQSETSSVSGQEIPYRGKEEERSIPAIDGPPPAYDAPSYSDASGQGSSSRQPGSQVESQGSGYPDEKAGGGMLDESGREGLPHYQGEGSGVEEYPDEKSVGSQNPYRNHMSGSSQGERAPPSTYQEDRLGPDQYPDEKSSRSPSPPKDEYENDLEDSWALDDAQDEITREPSQDIPLPTEDDFIRNHPPPVYSLQTPTTRLPLPVVIPQRRPKNRSRGFIRAYAPVLENCGIDQATWLEFLDSFQRNSAASPWINAINMAQFATIAIPFGIGLAVGYAIRQGTKAAIEVQGRERTNKFLYKINEEFFRPRGLYCLIMTWNPASPHHVEHVDLNATIASRSATAPGLTSKFRSSDGNTYGEWQFPETAPLIFPALDKLASQTGEEAEKKQGKMAQAKGFVGDYWDKRATAEYAGKNPNSMLANVPQAKFSSRYADPNDPAASGSLIAFVSGGHLVPGPNSRGLIGGLASAVKQKSQKGKEVEHYNPNAQGSSQYGGQQGYGYEEDNMYSRNYRGRRARRERRDMRRGGPRKRIIPSPVGGAKKLLNQNVLYMMVVNMPTESEMADAKAAAAGARRQS